MKYIINKKPTWVHWARTMGTH